MGKSPVDSCSKSLAEKFEHAPRGGGVDSLKPGLSIDSGADPGLISGSVNSLKRAGALRITSRYCSYLAGFLS